MILEPGRTCWRAPRASRVSFLIDGEAYFGALARALERARHSVWLVGWDFHSRVELRRGTRPGEHTDLVALLDGLVRERRDLRVHVLGWDFAFLYALEREFFPLLRFDTRTHRRVEFELDDRHPVGASHHQKLAVVDDAVAFAGGFDVTAERWDTREHRARDPRRETPGGTRYPPFHDVQIAVDGEVAAALGELARERWRRATGRRQPPPPAGCDPWPGDLEPSLRDVRVGIARTEPAYAGRPEVREVEALHAASIDAARRWIYVENQYLTSALVAERLERRLREPDGPEVVIVGPRRTSGWLEEQTMGTLRARLVARLRDADRHDRLRVYYPEVPGLAEDEIVMVHAKVVVVDDRLARVGSSNLSNRSIGLDTECDLAVEVEADDGAGRAAVARFRDDLLAEHLGTTPARVQETLREEGSLIRAVERLRGGPRTLRPLEPEAPDWDVTPLRLADPERPVALEDLLDRFLAEEREPAGRAHPWLWRLGASLALLLGLAAAWRFTPLAEHVSPQRLAQLAEPLRHGVSGLLLGAALFAGASLLMVPVTALVVAAALALGPALGFGVSLAGSATSAVAGYAAGRLLWRDLVRRLGGRRLNALSRRLARRGVLSTALVRLVPVAPFTVVNLVAGASHVRLRDFTLGTVLAMLPGIAALTLAAASVGTALRDPSAEHLAWAGVALALTLALLVGLGRLSRRRA